MVVLRTIKRHPLGTLVVVVEFAISAFFPFSLGLGSFAIAAGLITCIGIIPFLVGALRPWLGLYVAVILAGMAGVNSVFLGYAVYEGIRGDPDNAMMTGAVLLYFGVIFTTAAAMAATLCYCFGYGLRLAATEATRRLRSISVQV